MAHIVSSFDEDLVQVQAKISEMGGLCEELLSKSLESVQIRDAKLARGVIERDKALDALESALEEQVVRIIALRQPMAVDLRVLISALKIATTLERIGDLAKNIAKRAIPLSSARQVKLTTSIVRMGRATLTQLSDVLNAHASRDVDVAIQIWNQDYEIDEMYNAIFREVVTYMVEDSRLIGVGAHLLFLAKNLERIGDHTTQISEMIYYIVTGNSLGDDRPKGEPTGIDLPGEEIGILPDPAWKQATLNEPWSIGNTYHAAIGQGFVAVTPLQLLNAYAAVANGGTLQTPHFLKEVRASDGRATLIAKPPPIRQLPIKPEHLGLIREGARKVVTSGMAFMKDPKVVVAGKTGTAEFGASAGKDSAGRNLLGFHNWFASWVPKGDETGTDTEIAMVIFTFNSSQSACASCVSPAVTATQRVYELYHGKGTP